MAKIVEWALSDGFSLRVRERQWAQIGRFVLQYAPRPTTITP